MARAGVTGKGNTGQERRTVDGVLAGGLGGGSARICGVTGISAAVTAERALSVAADFAAFGLRCHVLKTLLLSSVVGVPGVKGLRAVPLSYNGAAGGDAEQQEKFGVAPGRVVAEVAHVQFGEFSPGRVGQAAALDGSEAGG